VTGKKKQVWGKIFGGSGSGANRISPVPGTMLRPMTMTSISLIGGLSIN
jgi:hypothetical protein